MSVVDLNADLGEMPGAEGRALDAAILAQVTSASVACGGHTGDADTMRRTFAACAEAGVSAGAHPSYPDREGFGRRKIDIGDTALADAVRLQIEAAMDAADKEGVALAHVKPHGALYHAAREGAEARLLVSLAGEFSLGLFGPPGAAVAGLARDAGVRFVAEGFADRAYRDGDLVPRSEAGAVIEAEDAQARQAIALARGDAFPGSPGPVRTICLHGDTPGAAESAARLRAALTRAGVEIRSP